MEQWSSQTYVQALAAPVEKNKFVPYSKNTDFANRQDQLQDVTTQLREHKDLITTITTQVTTQQELVEKLKTLLDNQTKQL